MKQLHVGIAVAASVVALSTAVARGSDGPTATFGAPPSGEIPILFNDQHVYAKPDKLEADRVLAALVRGNIVLVPLRSMFERMGATVSYDRASRTIDASKPGSNIRLTVGRRTAVINGEVRPLDVPPEISNGVLVVPIRVISETMGAYVQWVPERRVVVVRGYFDAAPAASPRPVPTAAAPVTAPTATPAPTTPVLAPTPVAKSPYEHFIVGDYVVSPRVYNEFSPGNSGSGSYAVRGAAEFPLFGLPWMLEGDYRSYSYPHLSGLSAAQLAGTGGVTSPACSGNGARDQGCVTVIGGYGQTAVPPFTARDADFDARLAVKIADPRVYVGAGYLHREENYGYPKQNGFGFGAEKLPDLERSFSVYASAWYYPCVCGSFQFSRGGPFVGSNRFTVHELTYQLGATFMLGHSGLLVDGGLLGDRIRGGFLAPSDASHAGAYAGLGLKF